MIVLLTFIAWMIPGLFVSRWWFQKRWPSTGTSYNSPSEDVVIGQSIAIAFFWLYFLIGYFSWGGIKKFYMP